MLDDEFLKQHPVSVFHGTSVCEGSVWARLSNPRVTNGIFRVGEVCLFQGIKRSQDHQRICPQDTRDLAEQKVARIALSAIQTRKIEIGLELEAPQLGQSPELKLIAGGQARNLTCER